MSRAPNRRAAVAHRIRGPRAVTSLTVACLAGASLLLQACANDHVTRATTANPATTGAAALSPTYETAASAASTGFAFLSPTVRVAAAPVGTFDGTRSPTVRIRCVTAAGPTCPTVRSLVMGSGASDIRVVASTSEYRVSWTSPSTLEVGSGRYAVDVLDGATVLGSAPLLATVTTRDASAAADNEIAVIRGKAVVISFRITTVPSLLLLAGTPEASAVEAVPDRAAPTTAQDFDRLHPVLVGIPVSFNTALVRLRPTATIGAVNALLTQVEGSIIGGMRGIADRVPARLMLRFPTTTHAQLEAKLALLRASNLVLGAVPEVRLQTAAVPRSAGATVPTGWEWDLRPAVSGNWALKTARVPQLWNLNRFTRRRGASVLTGIWETGIVDPHPDLPMPSILSAGVSADEHAMMVAGVLGARHDNGGIDGVFPFAQLVTVGGLQISLTASGVMDQLRVWTAANVPVVNASVGFAWPFNVVPSASNSVALALIDVLGSAVKDALTRLQEEGARLPVIVVSAGNQSSSSQRATAWLAGPLQNAATRQEVRAIIVVEALRRTFEGGSRPLELRVEPASFSTMDGHVAAGGEEIMSTTAGGTYRDGISGTSFSAPLVTGIVAYLMAVHPTIPAPTLTTNRFRELLELDAMPVTSQRGVAALNLNLPRFGGASISV